MMKTRIGSITDPEVSIWCVTHPQRVSIRGIKHPEILVLWLIKHPQKLCIRCILSGYVLDPQKLGQTGVLIMGRWYFVTNPISHLDGILYGVIQVCHDWGHAIKGIGDNKCYHYEHHFLQTRQLEIFLLSAWPQQCHILA